MMAGVTLGDLLSGANEQIERAISGRGRIDVESAIPHLRRITQTASRYLMHDQVAPADTRLHAALDQSATRLRQAESAAEGQPARKPGPRLRALAQASALLTAGTDLIAGHTSTGADGHRDDRSSWAGVLRTTTIAAALIEEMTHWADVIAWACDTLASLPAPVGSPIPVYLTAAARPLRETTARSMQPAGPGSTRHPGWELLYAVPAAHAPARQAPPRHSDITQDDLAEHIAVSAERLKAAAFIVPDQVRGPAAPNGQSMRGAAHVAAVMLEASRLVLTSPAATTDMGAGLGAVAVALDTAMRSWEQLTSAWEAFATDTDCPSAPASASNVAASELTLGLCRLILDDPKWKPGRGGKLSAELMPGLGDPSRYLQVLSAVHRACDAITAMAAADLDTIRLLAAAGRIYMPNWILYDPHTSREFVVALPARTELLIQAYQAAVQHASQAADTIGELVIIHDAPSKVLALARKALAIDGAHAPDPDAPDVPARLPWLQRPKYTRAVPANLLDGPAVVRAYRDEKLTLRECAIRFTTSAQTIRTILQASGIPIRPRGSRRPAGPSEPQSAAAQPGPVEHDMRTQGIHDPAVLSKARELDQAIARARLADAAQATRRPARNRTAAQLASMDQPPGQSSSPGTRTPAPDRAQTRARPSSRPAKTM
jgi:hypothetical protein